MAMEKDTFETDDTISSERKAAKSNIKTLAAEKARASGVFSGVLEKEKREKKSRRMQILITEGNFETLAKVSERTGRSKNDIINRLIATLKENIDL